jgi:CRP-like cAMP-binding protein
MPFMHETDHEISQKLAHFFAEYSPQAFPKGHVIIAAFSTPPGIYYLESGLVKQYSLSPEGDEFIVNVYKPGTFFPMIWAMTGKPNVFFFETLEPSAIRRAPAEKVIEFLHQEPKVLFDLLRRLYLGMDGLLTQLTQLAVGDTRRKVIATIIMMAKRFGKVDGQQILIADHVSHKHLSHFSGSSRESVTRMIGELEKQGLIEAKHRQIRVLDLESLERLLLE